MSASLEDGDNVRNGYSSKTLKTSLGEVPIRVPGSPEYALKPRIKKHQRDVSSIEGKVLAMYARGMSQRGHRRAEPSKTSTASRCHMNSISTITGRGHGRGRGMGGGIVRSSRSIHLLVDRIYVSSQIEYGVQQVVAHVMLFHDVNGRKGCPGPGINETEQACLDAIHESAPSRRWMILASCPWMAERIEEGAAAVFPACHGLRRRTPYPQFHPPQNPTQAGGIFTKQPEAHLWCHQRQAGPSGIREVQDRLAG